MAENQNWLKWAIRLQSLAQAGLAYGKDKFDCERFQEIRDIAAQMLVEPSGLPEDRVAELFCYETGYQTPKIDTRAAIFQGERILLVQEADGKWALPGGWCDVDLTVRENVIKEVKDEAGLDVTADFLVAVLDNSQAHPSSAYKVTKIFVRCTALGGHFSPNSETLASQYFALADLPVLSLHKTSREHIKLCFQAHQAQTWQTIFN